MLPSLPTITTAVRTGVGRLLYWGDMDLAGDSILSRTPPRLAHRRDTVALDADDRV
jgi:hypothetical protein